MRTIPPPLPDVTITHTQTGLSGGIPQNWGWPEQKKYGFTADFSAHHNFVVAQRQMVLSKYFSFTTSPPEI